MTDGRRAEASALWALRLLWILMPFTVGDALAGRLHDLDTPIRSTASLISWLGWGVGLGACAVPRAASLTCARIVVPVGLGAAAWAALDDLDAAAGVGVAIAGAALVVVLSAPSTDRFVDGSSYGAERRLGLRVPPMLLAGPAPLTWATVVAGFIAGPLLLAAQQWVAGAVALVVGVAVVWIGLRALHQLSRRWLVFVPAGVVVHDLLVMREPVLFQRHTVRGFGPARVDAEKGAVDLTRGAAGLVLHLDLTSAVGLPMARRDDTTQATSILVAPCRPGVAVAEATKHRLPIA